MSTSSLFTIMTVLFILGSSMDYEDAERLRDANRADQVASGSGPTAPSVARRG